MDKNVNPYIGKPWSIHNKNRHVLQKDQPWWGTLVINIVKGDMNGGNSEGILPEIPLYSAWAGLSMFCCESKQWKGEKSHGWHRKSFL